MTNATRWTVGPMCAALMGCARCGLASTPLQGSDSIASPGVDAGAERWRDLYAQGERAHAAEELSLERRAQWLEYVSDRTKGQRNPLLDETLSLLSWVEGPFSRGAGARQEWIASFGSRDLFGQMGCTSLVLFENGEARWTQALPCARGTTSRISRALDIQSDGVRELVLSTQDAQSGALAFGVSVSSQLLSVGRHGTHVTHEFGDVYRCGYAEAPADGFVGSAGTGDPQRYGLHDDAETPHPPQRMRLGQRTLRYDVGPQGEMQWSENWGERLGPGQCSVRNNPAVTEWWAPKP